MGYEAIVFVARINFCEAMRSRLTDLKALQSLVVVVEEGSMVAAAKRLSYSQSAISMQLRRLEDDLGAELIQRDQSNIRLTRIGRTAVGYAREMLRLNRDLRAEMFGDEVNGLVRFGLPADLAPILRSAWAQFADLYPRVQLEVRSELSVTLIKQLSEGTIDLAVVTLPVDSGDGITLRREPMVWIGSPGTTAHLADPLPLAIGPDGGCEFRSTALARLNAEKRAWRVAYESQAFGALSAQVSVGLAISIAIPSMMEPGLEVLAPDKSGLPELPPIDIKLCMAPGAASRQSQSLAEVVLAAVK